MRNKKRYAWSHLPDLETNFTFADIIKAILTASKSEQPTQEDIWEIIHKLSVHFFTRTQTHFVLARTETQYKGCIAAILSFTPPVLDVFHLQLSVVALFFL